MCVPDIGLGRGQDGEEGGPCFSKRPFFRFFRAGIDWGPDLEHSSIFSQVAPGSAVLNDLITNGVIGYLHQTEPGVAHAWIE
jgi:hypothetical protein